MHALRDVIRLTAMTYLLRSITYQFFGLDKKIPLA